MSVDSRYEQTHKLRGWNGRVKTTQDARLMRQEFPELSRADHARLAKEYMARANRTRTVYRRTLKAAIAKYGERPGGGSVSGIYSEHFPTPIKNKLRALATRSSKYMEIAHAHWGASGKRTRLHTGWTYF